MNLWDMKTVDKILKKNETRDFQMQKIKEVRENVAQSRWGAYQSRRLYQFCTKDVSVLPNETPFCRSVKFRTSPGVHEGAISHLQARLVSLSKEQVRVCTVRQLTHVFVSSTD
jgi:hypothetical protein